MLVKDSMMGSYFTTRNNSNQDKHSEIDQAKAILRNSGHFFSAKGKLCRVGTNAPFIFNLHRDHSENQRRYEKLGKDVENYIYALLQDKGGLKKVNLPFGERNYSGSNSFIFKSPDLEKKDKILVLMHGSGVVRAGQWSRRLIINVSLEAGSMLPYIQTAHDFGYGVVVLNTNQNERFSYHNHNSSPESHFKYVWTNLIEKLNKPVAIVTHSYGGSVVMEAAKSIPGFMEQTFAVALTDCWVSDSPKIRPWLYQHVSNWVTSHLPLGTVVNSHANCRTVSGGTRVHEETPWKAYFDIWSFIAHQESHNISRSPDTCFALTGQQRNCRSSDCRQGEDGVRRRSSSRDRQEKRVINNRGRSFDRRETTVGREKATRGRSLDLSQPKEAIERGRSPIRSNSSIGKNDTKEKPRERSSSKNRGEKEALVKMSFAAAVGGSQPKEAIERGRSPIRRNFSIGKNYTKEKPRERSLSKSKGEKETLLEMSYAAAAGGSQVNNSKTSNSTSSIKDSSSLPRDLRFSMMSTDLFIEHMKRNKKQTEPCKRTQPIRSTYTPTAPYATSYSRY